MIHAPKENSPIIGPVLLLFVGTIAWAKLGFWIAAAIVVVVFLVMPYPPPPDDHSPGSST